MTEHLIKRAITHVAALHEVAEGEMRDACPVNALATHARRLEKERDEARRHLALLSVDADRLRRELDDAKGVIR